MLKSLEQKYIRRMAKLYRKSWKEPTIRQAIFQASKAYEIYREAEIEVIDEAYEKEMYNA